MGLFDGARLAVLDTETTGFERKPGAKRGRNEEQEHHIVEVACVPIDDGRIGGPWSALVDPGCPIPPDAARVHGITNEMVRGQPRAAEIAGELERRCAGRVLVFHNADFDLPFLAKDFGLPVFVALSPGAEVPLFGPWVIDVPAVIDTLGLARALGDAGSNALGDLAGRLGVSAATAHRAAGDALTTAGVLLKLGERWEREKGVRTLDELAAESRKGLLLTGRRPRG